MSKILDIWRIPNYCQKNPAPKLSDSWKQTDVPWAIFYHIGRNWDTLQFFTKYWNIFPKHHLPTIVFTYHDDQEQDIIDKNMKIIDEHADKIRTVKWLKVPNRGTDIYPFFHAFDALGELSNQYVLILKLHAKKSNQEWIETLVQDCLPSADWIDWFLNVATLRDDLGMICSTNENLDWINTPLLFDYWIRGGIIPRPIYKSDKIPRYKKILNDYNDDAKDDKFLQEYPAPKNQYRKNGLLMDQQVYWWHRENPMGMKTEGHNICNSIQKAPFLMQYFQQIGVNPGTVFWITPKVCQLILNYFPLQTIFNTIESGAVKDNLWQRNAHTWERFFTSYTLLQGFTVIDTKHRVHFKSLPYELVSRSFTGWNDLDIPFSDRIAVFSQNIPNKFIKKPQTPWFPFKGDRLPLGVATGNNIVYPTIVTGPDKIKKNKRDNCNWVRKMTWRQWMDVTRVPREEDNPVWQHVMLNTKESIVDFLDKLLFTATHEKPSRKTPWITIWTTSEFNYFLFEQWEQRNLFWLAPRVWVENIVNFSTYATLSLWIIEFMEQVTISWPSSTKIEWINFENTYYPKTLKDVKQEYENNKQELIFFGSNLIKPWLVLQTQSYHNTFCQKLSMDANGPIQFVLRAPIPINKETYETCFDIFHQVQLFFPKNREFRKSYLSSYMKHYYQSELHPWNVVTPWLKKNASKSEVVISNEDPMNYIFLYDTTELYAEGMKELPHEWHTLQNFLSNQDIMLHYHESILSKGSHIIFELHLSPIHISDKIVTIGGIHQQLYQNLVIHNLKPTVADIAICSGVIKNFAIYAKVFFRANTIGDRMLFKPMVQHYINAIRPHFPLDEQIHYSVKD